MLNKIIQCRVELLKVKSSEHLQKGEIEKRIDEMQPKCCENVIENLTKQVDSGGVA